jgi:hypothetical protein
VWPLTNSVALFVTPLQSYPAGNGGCKAEHKYTPQTSTHVTGKCCSQHQQHGPKVSSCSWHTIQQLSKRSRCLMLVNTSCVPARRLDVPRPRSQGALPKISADARMDRIHAARRGAAIMGALGHPELDKLAAKVSAFWQCASG